MRSTLAAVLPLELMAASEIFVKGGLIRDDRKSRKGASATVSRTLLMVTSLRASAIPLVGSICLRNPSHPFLATGGRRCRKNRNCPARNFPLGRLSMPHASNVYACRMSTSIQQAQEYSSFLPSHNCRV